MTPVPICSIRVGMVNCSNKGRGSEAGKKRSVGNCTVHFDVVERMMRWTDERCSVQSMDQQRSITLSLSPKRAALLHTNTAVSHRNSSTASPVVWCLSWEMYYWGGVKCKSMVWSRRASSLNSSGGTPDSIFTAETLGTQRYEKITIPRGGRGLPLHNQRTHTQHSSHCGRPPQHSWARQRKGGQLELVPKT